MLDTKWTLFLFIVFAVGQLLSFAVTNTHLGSDFLDTSQGIINEEALQNLELTLGPGNEPVIQDLTQSSNIVSSLARLFEAGKSLGVRLVGGLFWDYPFLENSFGFNFKLIILWPVSIMFSFAFINFLASLFRVVF